MKVRDIHWIDCPKGSISQTILGNIVIIKHEDNLFHIYCHYQYFKSEDKIVKTLEEGKKVVKRYCDKFLKDISFYLE